MQVRDLMNESVVSATLDATATQLARLLARHDVGAIPICDGAGHLQGIVTDRDIILRCIAAEEDPRLATARELMSKAPATVSPADDAREATRLMAEKQVRRLPVVEGGALVGMLALGDLAVTHAFTTETSKALSDISAEGKR